MMIYYVVLGMSILAGIAGQMLLKAGADAPNLVAQILRPSTLIGLAFYGSAAFLYIFALRKIPLSVAFPSVSLSYAVVAVQLVSGSAGRFPGTVSSFVLSPPPQSVVELKSMPPASPRKSQIRQRLQAIGLDELQRRLNRAVLWEGLSFSLARWWTEVLGTGRTHCSHLITGLLQRQAHSTLFGVSHHFTDEESELLKLLGKIRHHYDGAFKYDMCSLKTAGSKLLLKYGSSLEKGVSYDARTWIGPDEIRAHVLHHAQQSEVHNRNLIALLRRMAPDAEVAEQILKMFGE